VKQDSDYLETKGLLPLLQSAYRSKHSTETALSDVLTAIDDKKVTLLAPLDLIAAFDCVDHDILLSWLQSRFGLPNLEIISAVSHRAKTQDIVQRSP